MHAASAALSRFANTVTSSAKGVAARTAALDREQLIKGAMIGTLAVGTLAPIVFAGSATALITAQLSLVAFSGLLVTVILT